jgi:hypothetical protein
MINGLGSIGGVPMTVSTITVYENNVVPTGSHVSTDFIMTYMINQISQLNTDGAYLLLPNNAIVRAWANTTVAQNYVNFMSNGNNAGGHLSANINSITITEYIQSPNWKHILDTGYYSFNGKMPANVVINSAVIQSVPFTLSDLVAANAQANAQTVITTFYSTDVHAELISALANI